MARTFRDRRSGKKNHQVGRVFGAKIEKRGVRVRNGSTRYPETDHGSGNGRTSKWRTAGHNTWTCMGAERGRNVETRDRRHEIWETVEPRLSRVMRCSYFGGQHVGDGADRACAEVRLCLQTWFPLPCAARKRTRPSGVAMASGCQRVTAGVPDAGRVSDHFYVATGIGGSEGRGRGTDKDQRGCETTTTELLYTNFIQPSPTLPSTDNRHRVGTREYRTRRFQYEYTTIIIYINGLCYDAETMIRRYATLIMSYRNYIVSST